MPQFGRGVPSPLSRQLVKCREESGYMTARAFFDASGGTAVLRCDYATYRRMERSAKIPGAKVFAGIYEALDRVCGRGSLLALCRAYAQVLLGPDLCAPPGDGRKTSAVGRLPAFIPESAWRAVLRDPAGLAGLAALERGRARPEDLPVAPRRARRTLENFVRQGLARRARGRYELAPRAPVGSQTGADKGMLSRQSALLASLSGDAPRGATELIRGDRSDMEALFRHIWDELCAQACLARGAPAPESEVYLLTVSVRDLGCARVK